MTSQPIPIVIDTDTGTDVDDALALLLALASPEVNLIGVTVVDGDVDTRARIVARLLGMAGRPDIPIYKGAARPLGPGRGPTWFGHEGKGLLDIEYEGPEAVVHNTPAHDWLIEQSKHQPFHLVAVGPFTNLALAFRQDPSFGQRLLHLTVMGGMAHEAAYTSKWKQFFADTSILPAHMDHNTASDVDAALTVARAGMPMTWVTAELTFCTPLNRRALSMFRASATALGQALARLVEIWNDEWFHFIPQFPDYPSPFPQDSVACLHDPLALASLFPGPWLTLCPHHLEFAVEGPLFRIHETEEAGEAQHLVSVAVDTAAFESFYLERVGRYLQSLSP